MPLPGMLAAVGQVGPFLGSLFCWGDKWRQLPGRRDCWAEVSCHAREVYGNFLSFTLHFKMKRNTVSDIGIGIVTCGQVAFLLTVLDRR